MKTTVNHFHANCLKAATLALLVAPFALLADVDWTAYAKAIDITFPGYTGGTTLTDFPVLVRLSATRNKFDYSKCQANGADLRFSDAEGNLLSHEIDTWNTTGESLVWVKVPSFNADAVITAHYGFTGGQLPSVTASDVWSADYVGVWHMKESGTPLAESSGVSTPIDTAVAAVAFGYDGAIGKAVDMSSVTGGWANKMSAADDDDLDGFTDFTLEMWTRQEEWGSNNNPTLLSKRSGTDNAYNWCCREVGDKRAANMVLSTNGTSNADLNGNRACPVLGVWTHQAFVRNIGENYIKAFVSGTNSFTRNSYGTLPIVSNSQRLAFGSGANGYPFPGQMDEIRISRVARSADWIKVTSDCVTDDDFAEYAPVVGNDWGKYSHKFTMTFTGYTGSETLTNFPVLVKIAQDSPNGFSYSDCLKALGGDLRFADADGNLLASEIDTWNPNGVSLIWVKVPTLSSSTKITAYYGWESAPAVNAANVWANDYVGVWHMKETTLPLAESSGVSTPFHYKQGNVVLGYASGAIGAAVDCNGASSWFDVLRADDDDDLDGFTAFTLEMWTKQAEGTWSTASNYGMMEKRPAKNTETSGNSYYWYENKDKAGAAGVLFYTGDAGTAKYGTGNAVKPEPNVWTHQAFVRTTGTNRRYYSYVSGTNSWNTASGNDDPVTSSSSYLMVGGSGSGGRFPGQIDEVRISRTSRSADWIKATSDCVTKANFVTYSSAKAVTRHTVLIFH